MRLLIKPSGDVITYSHTHSFVVLFFFSPLLTDEPGDDQPFVANNEKANNLYLYSVSSLYVVSKCSQVPKSGKWEVFHENWNMTSVAHVSLCMPWIIHPSILICNEKLPQAFSRLHKSFAYIACYSNFLLFFTLQEELHERPQITSMIGSLANYSNTIPSAPDAAADGDAKPPQPSAQMGMYSLDKDIYVDILGFLRRTATHLISSVLRRTNLYRKS